MRRIVKMIAAVGVLVTLTAAADPACDRQGGSRPTLVHGPVTDKYVGHDVDGSPQYNVCVRYEKNGRRYCLIARTKKQYDDARVGQEYP